VPSQHPIVGTKPYDGLTIPYIKKNPDGGTRPEKIGIK